MRIPKQCPYCGKTLSTKRNAPIHDCEVLKRELEEEKERIERNSEKNSV